jgi:Uncharacterized conserved protein
MKRALKLLSLAILFILILTSCETLGRDETESVIEVTGRSELSVAPDMGTLTVSATVVKDTTAEASTAMKALQADALRIIESCGIDASDIKTGYIEFGPEYYYGENGRELKGQRASSSYEVTVRNLSSVGPLYDALSTLSSINVSSLSLSTSKAVEYQDEARRSAAEDARRLAELYAAALGKKVGDVLYISESSGYAVRTPNVYLESKSMAMGAADSIDFRENDISVSSSVFVRFELE